MSRGTAAPGVGSPLSELARATAGAVERLAGLVVRTPVAPFDLDGSRPLFKLETRQHTGSFKYRGALNKLLSTPPERRRRGFVAASSGNHGLALARALRETGCEGTLFLPETAAPVKIRSLRKSGVALRFSGAECVEAEEAARAFAEASGATYVSPYNDWEVMAGQGTVGVELLEQVPDLEAVVVSVGGGGLLAGIAGTVRARRPEIEIVGAQPAASAAMAAAVGAGRIVDVPHRPTLADGSAGAVESDTLTLEPCRALVDRFILVGEAEIGAAMALLLRRSRLVVEGSAGVAVAAYLRLAEEWRGRRVAVVICGRNVALSTLKGVLRGTATGGSRRIG